MRRRRKNTGGLGATKFQFSVRTNFTITGSTAADTFYLALNPLITPNFNVDWGDGTDDDITVWNQAELTHVYPANGTYTITVTGGQCAPYINNQNANDRSKWYEIFDWSGCDISRSSVFFGCGDLIQNTSADTTKPTISGGTLERTFRNCTDFNGDIGNWDLTGVSSVQYMFLACRNINCDINWDMTDVTNARGLFWLTHRFNGQLNWTNTGGINNWIEFFRQSGTVTPFTQTFDNTDFSGGNQFTNFGNTWNPPTATMDNLLINLDSSGVINEAITLDGTYTLGGAAETAYNNLISKGWTITGLTGV